MRRNLAALALILTAAAPIGRKPAAQPAPNTAPAVKPVPGPPGRDGNGTARPAGVFSPLDFGAKADGVTDDSEAVQAAADAASAFTAADPGRSAVLDMRGDFGVGATVHMEGSRVTARGPGRLRPVNYYGGPMLAPGVHRLTPAEAAAHRPPATALDVTAPGRRALATLGTHTLTVAADPITLGASPWNFPDYWQGDEGYTFETLLVRPGGAAWGPGTTFWGAWSGNDPDPVGLYRSADGFTLLVKAEGQPVGTSHHAEAVTADPGPVYRICFQVDVAAGAFSAWVNGRPCQVRQPAGWTPGTKPRKPSGGSAWQLGTHEAQVTDLRCEGHCVTKGQKYKAGSDPQARLDGTAVTDLNRYFTRVYPGNPGETVALFALDEAGAPGTAATVLGPMGGSAGFWVPSQALQARQVTGGELAFENLTITGGVGAAVTTGQVLGLRFSDCRIGGALQGVGSLSYGCAYPVLVERCRLDGRHTPYFGFQQIATLRDCDFAGVGRHAFLFCGGTSVVRNCLVSSVAADTESLYRYLANGYGANHLIADNTVDIEYVSGLRAVVECDQHPYWRTSLRVEGLGLGTIGGAQRLLRLNGFGADGDVWKPARFVLSGVGYWDGKPDAAIEADGPGWYGTADLTQYPTGAVTGDGRGINVVGPSGP